MQKLRAILGLPVLETKSGTQIGEAQEVVVDIERASVVGIIVANANWLAEIRGILFPDIFSIGRDAIMVRDKDTIQEFPGYAELIGMQRLSELFDRQIYTETGLALGVLVDILFDAETGEIKGYELSDGIVADLLEGRKVMPLPQAQVISADKLIVPETMAKLLHAE
ncbi:MAG: PRC-barrel domain-containing protein [Negativicutes bacterium]|nr:PRC-barrel domain-containing protein [Negativicutes bacterium]